MNKKMLSMLIITFVLLFMVVDTVSAQTYTDARARQILAIAGIEVNHPAPRTSLEGIRVNTINAIVALNRAIGGGIVITGGTESGHASGTYSHANGYKVDLRLNSTLNNYIERNFRRDGSVGGFPAYRCPAGNLYVRESTHWDVVVY